MCVHTVYFWEWLVFLRQCIIADRSLGCQSSNECRMKDVIDNEADRNDCWAEILLPNYCFCITRRLINNYQCCSSGIQMSGQWYRSTEVLFVSQPRTAHTTDRYAYTSDLVTNYGMKYHFDSQWHTAALRHELAAVRSEWGRLMQWAVLCWPGSKVSVAAGTVAGTHCQDFTRGGPVVHETCIAQAYCYQH